MRAGHALAAWLSLEILTKAAEAAQGVKALAHVASMLLEELVGDSLHDRALFDGHRGTLNEQSVDRPITLGVCFGSRSTVQPSERVAGDVA
jgi:hypothetical protein